MTQTIAKSNVKELIQAQRQFFATGQTKELAFRLEQEKESIDLIHKKLTVREAVEKYDLTKREHTVLALLLEGKDNPMICNELSISVNTLKKHILNIYRKLEVKNRVQLFKMIKEKE